MGHQIIAGPGNILWRLQKAAGDAKNPAGRRPAGFGVNGSMGTDEEKGMSNALQCFQRERCPPAQDGYC